ncbi:YbjN domain-containing protein [Erythrobacter sp. JK5]|uniref:YbjN domain-containing protein n=1 Tax=Erythrobacter sp. JK5 TaxID=2829500 RepID=UPI001BA63380|nr:YbjN domain-containing protein [Erythrobacter sp. JK5]QUL38579.1 YbjN domain-containing protein [Erythrobacter sp. JK5]
MNWTRTAALSAALALALGTAAQAQDSDTIQTFTKADFTQALDAVGATYDVHDDRRNIDISFGNGLKADGLLMACDDNETESNCYGTSILATFSAPTGADDASIAKAIGEYNYRENFGRAYLDPEGTISVRMYIISDGGIVRENYSRQIELWATSLGDFIGYLYPEEDGEEGT